MICKNQIFVADMVVIILTQRQWLQMLLISQQVQLRNLAPLLKSANIEGFMKGTTLF
jgi:hypothetical protein